MAEGATQHNLYVKIVQGGDKDAVSSGLTLQVLRYVHGRIAILRKMGLQVKVHKVTSQSLQDARVRAAMKSKGIKRLPAMTTPTNVYHGLKEVIDIYERNIKEFTAIERKEEKRIEGMSHEDDLSSYYRDEMSFDRAESDDGEVGMGESGDMMSAYQSMMSRRDERKPKSRPDRTPPSRSGPAPRGPAQRGPAQRGPAPRDDNIGAPEGDSDEIRSLINQMAGDIDAGTVATAFSGGGGDSLDGGGEADSSQDALMEKSYWANQESST